jgi:hypothetical protein
MMRALLIAVLLTGTLGTFARVAIAGASDATVEPPAPAVERQETVDDNDDTRVEVQVTVLVVVLAIVVGLGIPLYFLRRKLGLVPPPPEQPEADAHH